MARYNVIGLGGRTFGTSEQNQPFISAATWLKKKGYSMICLEKLWLVREMNNYLPQTSKEVTWIH